MTFSCIKSLSPELFLWELYDACGPLMATDDIRVATSIGFCDASRLRVRPRPSEFALMIELPNGDKYWFHAPLLLLYDIDKRLQRKLNFKPQLQPGIEVPNG